MIDRNNERYKMKCQAGHRTNNKIPNHHAFNSFCCSHKTEIVFNVMCFELDEWATQMENINSKFEQPFVHENGIQLVRRIDSNIVIYVQNTSNKKTRLILNVLSIIV